MREEKKNKMSIVKRAIKVDPKNHTLYIDNFNNDEYSIKGITLGSQNRLYVVLEDLMPECRATEDVYQANSSLNARRIDVYDSSIDELEEEFDSDHEDIPIDVVDFIDNLDKYTIVE